MKSFSQISGAKVICAEGGKQIGKVESVVCAGDRQVLGVLLQLSKRISRYGFVCVEDILAIEDGGICIFGENSIQKEKRQVQAYRKKGDWIWMNKKAVTPEGRLLGTISDALFDVQSGKISQVELSLSVMEDLREGRRRFSLTDDAEFGTEFLVLKDGGRQDE